MGSPKKGEGRGTDPHEKSGKKSNLTHQNHQCQNPKVPLPNFYPRFNGKPYKKGGKEKKKLIRAREGTPEMAHSL